MSQLDLKAKADDSSEWTETRTGARDYARNKASMTWTNPKERTETPARTASSQRDFLNRTPTRNAATRTATLISITPTAPRAQSKKLENWSRADTARPGKMGHSQTNIQAGSANAKMRA